MFATLYPYRLYIVAAGGAFLASLLLTPVVRWLAYKLELVDRPDNHRKLHAKNTALGGGVAILLAFLAASLFIVVLSPSQRAILGADTRFVIGVVVASLFIVGLGLADDRWKLRGRQKLVGQAIAASMLVAAGLWIQHVEVLGWELDLGVFAIPFTLFWLLGAINSLNLIDGMDGLATSVGLVVSLAIAAMAAILGHRTEAFLALIMAGSLAGFLIYNSPPASVFLGDAGSMLIGLILGALAIRSSIKGPATIALAAPAAIWAIPILDVLMAILRRKLTGRSIYTTDRGHLHHNLQHVGLSGTMTVCLIGALCLLTSLGAVISVAIRQEWVAYASVVATFGILVVTGLFGRHEVLLLLRRTRQFSTSLVRPLGSPQSIGHQFEARLQGNGEWDELWNTLVDFAHRFELASVQLNVHLPALGEDYHATWQRREQPDEAQLWHSDIPLMAHNTNVGRIKLTGSCNNGSVCTWMSDLVAGLKPFETQMLELIEQSVAESAAAKRNGKRSRAESANRSGRRAVKAAPKPS